ncbi:glycosyltransferase family 10 (fucosyltransferase) c-term domain-containing protein [Phthorimaea operculella]|nr:glycosyltransferase family 10 (fucosyltransferase) c-term domain-containing protein [Phthorimaea operculella]
MQHKSDFKIKTVIKLHRFIKDLRHVLIWTELPGVLYEGQKDLTDRRCAKYNCYFTRNRTLFGDLRYFDAIVFNLQQVIQGAEDLPKQRGYKQKYIFAANDSADNFPVCHKAYDSFFNWTWTYRKDSTIKYRFVTVQTIQGQDLDGDVRWRENMKQLDDFRKKQLDTKSKAVAIFLDKCRCRSKREEFVEELKKELTKLNQTLDIYGNCGLKCKRKSMAPCNYRIRKSYFFYLALEDSKDKDFLTDEVLHGYQNDAVPIVVGGEMYFNYLPKDSYLDASKFKTPADLASEIQNIISHRSLYYDFFKWKAYYTVSRGKILDPCRLCDELNIVTVMRSHMHYPRFRSWWNPDFGTRCPGGKS